MSLHQTTPVPNQVFDNLITILSGAELKVFLIIIRQTLGWQLRNGKRKERDRISISQFMNKTGLSRRKISTAIQALSDKGHITITDRKYVVLKTPQSRKGKVSIYYAPCLPTSAQKNTNLCTLGHQPVQKGAYNKRKVSKEKRQKAEKQGTKFLSDKERINRLLKV